MHEYDINPRSSEYEEYLRNHIEGVRKTWDQFLSSAIYELFPTLYNEINRCIILHDDSKYSEDEWDAYCNYFYPCEGYEQDEEAFDYAWLHHQNTNPHHWQYWVLIRDSGDIVPMDMPIDEIINMLCDWHSFSAKDPNSTAYNWYYKNKDNMLLSDNTRDIVESFVEYLKEPLTM